MYGLIVVVIVLLVASVGFGTSVSLALGFVVVM